MSFSQKTQPPSYIVAAHTQLVWAARRVLAIKSRGEQEDSPDAVDALLRSDPVFLFQCGYADALGDMRAQQKSTSAASPHSAATAARLSALPISCSAVLSYGQSAAAGVQDDAH